MRTHLTAAALVMATIATLGAQSLRERARRQDGTARTSLSLWLVPLKMPELLAASDLVLYGRIANVTTHLSPDESLVMTQYEVTPIQTVKQRAPMTSVKPGQRLTIIVERAGGVLTEGQYRYQTDVDAYPESESFKVGEEVVLFLQYDLERRLFILTDGPFGGFRVAGSAVQPMTREVAEMRGDLPVDIGALLLSLRQNPGNQ